MRCKGVEREEAEVEVEEKTEGGGREVGRGEGRGPDCLPFEWKFRGLRVTVRGVEWYLPNRHGPTQYIKDLIPNRPWLYGLLA